MIEQVHRAAERLAHDNLESEPHIVAIYLFPSDDEIRLIELDPMALPADSIVPFHFAADAEEGTPFRSAIAVIRPEERSTFAPPGGFGGVGECDPNPLSGW